MLQLLLLRHAKSAWDDPKAADRTRPLSRRGERAAAAIGRAMAERGLAPDLILASPARRSLQTLAALAPLPPSTRIETPEALYLAEAETLLAVLRELPNQVTSVLAIGHNPGLHELAVKLAGAGAERPDVLRLAQSFPTAALAEFALNGRWADLGRRPSRLVRFLLPRDLPELAA
ncbi:MAG: histidine phosphatase family protein [Rhodospirillales bacterium]|nr:histidine phosphatase family protein [Rhodospirillales bacterium]